MTWTTGCTSRRTYFRRSKIHRIELRPTNRVSYRDWLLLSEGRNRLLGMYSIYPPKLTSNIPSTKIQPLYNRIYPPKLTSSILLISNSIPSIKNQPPYNMACPPKPTSNSIPLMSSSFPSTNNHPLCTQTAGYLYPTVNPLPSISRTTDPLQETNF